MRIPLVGAALLAATLLLAVAPAAHAQYTYPDGYPYTGYGYPYTGYGYGYPYTGYGYPYPGYPYGGYPFPGYPYAGYPFPGYPYGGYPYIGFPYTGTTGQQYWCTPPGGTTQVPVGTSIPAGYTNCQWR